MRDPETEKDLWWGPYSPNYVMDDRTFLTNRERAIDYLNTLDRVYVVDAFVNWDPEVSLCTHPLFASAESLHVVGLRACA